MTATAWSRSRPARPPGGGRAGLTLLEVMLVMLLLSAALPVLVETWLFVTRHTALARAQRDVQFEANAALQDFARDLMNANALVTMTSSYVEAQIDRGAGYQTFRYYQSGTGFLRARTDDGFTAGEGDLLGENLEVAGFTYYQRDGTVATLVGQVRLLRLTATFSRKPVPTFEAPAFSFALDVFLHNRDWGPNGVPDSPLLSITGSSSFKAGANKTFRSNTTDPDGDQVQHTVSWGDATSSTSAFVASGADATFSHAWSSPGTYQVTSTAVDALGATSPVSNTITVTVNP